MNETPGATLVRLAGLAAFLVIVGLYGATRGWWVLPEGLVPAGIATPTPTAPAEWYPADFSLCASESPEIACRWLERTTCEFGWTCESLEVIPFRACEMIYVEVSQLSAGNTVLGFANDLTGHVGAQQRARMHFTYTEDGFAHREITKVTCHPI